MMTNTITAILFNDDFKVNIESQFSKERISDFPINPLPSNIIEEILEDFEGIVEREHIEWDKYENNQYYFNL